VTAPTFTVDTCKSATCGARIIWAVTVHGELMPVDADPDPDGNLELVPEPRYPDSRMPNVIVHEQPTLWAGTRWHAHFVTCPEADKWRKP
jgi:hypothetical protein